MACSIELQFEWRHLKRHVKPHAAALALGRLNSAQHSLLSWSR
jgi:hypothetical protein